MAVLAFVLLWVLVGTGLVFVAISGGPAGARARLAGQGRTARRLTLLGFIVALLVLGVGIPAAVTAGVDDRDDIPEVNVADLTDHEKRGRELFGSRCGICHTLQAANTSARVGPNLDTLRPPKNLVLDAIKNGRARGNGQMAADIVEGDDADAVASFVAKAVGQTTAGGK
jgi:mono/diheme cytochrome c family protein